MLSFLCTLSGYFLGIMPFLFDNLLHLFLFFCFVFYSSLFKGEEGGERGMEGRGGGRRVGERGKEEQGRREKEIYV